MSPDQSFTCPHCETSHPFDTEFDSMPAGAPSHPDWAVYVLVCPVCNKALGVYSMPTR